MGQALYRKYRSRKLDEIVGQEHITRTLKQALSADAISHAYLFTGPHGVGKTSIARIMAYEVNKLPYDEQSTHLDIIEIDAASNRRIDEIRELRERVHISPAQAKYKVYIIDEVHMLTKEAFNALLKTLEEPPAHAIFILATTEAHKLPETIISRTQRFTFKPIENAQVSQHLRFIADEEKIKATDEALELIAAHGNGSFRDSISLLDQASGLEKVTEEDVRRMLGVPPDEAINNLQSALAGGSPKAVIEQLGALREQGYHAANVAKQLSAKLRQLLINGEKLATVNTASLLKSLIDIPASHDPDTLLEITLIECVINQKDLKDGEVQTTTTIRPAVVNSTEPTHQPKPQNEKKAAVSKHQQQQERSSSPKAGSKTNNSKTLLDDKIWQKVLTATKEKHNTLYSVIRMAKPSINKDQVTLTFSFAFHQKRVNDNRNKQVIKTILSDNLGRSIELECIVEPKNEAAKPATEISEPNNKTDSFAAISNIFGDTEVIE